MVGKLCSVLLIVRCHSSGVFTEECMRLGDDSARNVVTTNIRFDRSAATQSLATANQRVR